MSILQCFSTFSWVIIVYACQQHELSDCRNVHSDICRDNVFSRYFLSFCFERESNDMHLVEKKLANMSRLIILLTISSLYLLCVCYFILRWYLIYQSVLINGTNRESIFSSTTGVPLLLHVLASLFTYSLITVSDGLLVGIILFCENVSPNISVDMEVLPCLGTIVPNNLCSSDIYDCRVR